MAKNTNTESTRFYSDAQEKSIIKALGHGCTQQPNSGAGHFRKGDILCKQASMLIEAKCSMSEKDSFSVKKEWLTKNKEECFTQRVSSGCVAFNFGPNQSNFYIINESMMQYLIEKLAEENS